MDIEHIRASLVDFSAKENAKEQSRINAYKDLVNIILSIRTACIPNEVRPTFDNLPVHKLPNLLKDLNADPNAIRDLDNVVYQMEKVHNRNLSVLNFKLVHESVLKAKESNVFRNPAPNPQIGIDTGRNMEVKSKGSDGPSR